MNKHFIIMLLDWSVCISEVSISALKSFSGFCSEGNRISLKEMLPF